MKTRLALSRKTLSLACSLILIGASGSALASGFAVPEISITGLGTSNALVANPDELGAIPYNPAAAVHHPTSISSGLMGVAPSLSVTTDSGSHDSGSKSVIAIPAFQGVYRLNDRTALGLGITAPLGLETSWDAMKPVFPSFAALAIGGHPTESKIEVVDIAPTLSYKLNDNLSISAGLDYYFVKTVEFNADIVDNSGDGDALGWNFGLLYVEDRFSFGMSYRSGADSVIEGETVFAAGVVAPVAVTTPARAELPLPSRFQAGVRYEVSDKLALELDLSRTGWSTFDTLTIDNAISPVVSKNNWDDTNAYRLGGTYQLNNKTQLRFGYTFDETGQPSEYFSPRVPDTDRHLFSIGVGHDLGDGWNLEAGYMHVAFKEYTHAASGFTEIGETNGSFLVNGEYDASVNLFGIGISKTFM